MKLYHKRLFAILSILMVVLISSCGAQSKDVSSQEMSVSQEDSSSVKDTAGSVKSSVKQELVIGEQFDLESIDPADGMLDDTQILVYNSLVELDSDFKQTPGLAESWEMSPDGTTWTFHLRKNVTFHDGALWNADAAVTNLEGRLKDYPAMSQVNKLETPDEYTLIFHLDKPVYTLTSELSRTSMSMVSPDAINEDGSLKEAAGTGPYKLVKWEKDQEFVFEANNDFWGGKPNIQKITYKIITDPQARAMALESGEIDMMSGYQSLSAIKKLVDDDRFQLIKKTQNTSSFILFNINKEPLDSLAVRQAIGNAVDLDAIVNNLLVGLASPPSGFFSPAYGDLVNPNISLPSYDLDKAKQLLEQDGWIEGEDGIRVKDGKRLSVSLSYGASNTEDSLLAPAFKDALAEAGIEVELKPLESAALGEIQETKDYDMVLCGQSFIPTDDPTFHYTNGYWHSDSYYKIYTSDKLDSMIEELQAEMDPDKRKELHWAIQQEIMDNIPFLMVYHRNSIRLAKSNISNFDISSGCWHINRALKDAVIN